METVKNLSFEEAFSELESILQKMNEGEVPLEKLVELFEKGNSLLGYCQAKLEEAEKKIEILLKTKEGHLSLNELGIPEKAPFSLDKTSLPLSDDEPL